MNESVPAGAELRETHTGLVVLVGDRAYKVKKPLATDFLDFRTARSRELACARELELNRRIAPDVYLGIVHFSDPVNGATEPVLVMRRMPDDRRLATLLESHREPDIAELAGTLARFHAAAKRGPEVDRFGTAEAVWERWQPVLRTLREQTDLIDPAIPDKLEARALRYLHGRRALFQRRITEGKIIDGHGDLLAQDIFVMPDGYRILDCLDFDDTLRYLDCIDDIAFLAMDLEFLGHRDVSDRFIAEYRRVTGDTAPNSLCAHYIAYRALVRAKVDLIRWAQGDDAALERAHRHLVIADGRTARSAIRLALVGGLPGTGKSTVAQQLSREFGATVLSSDDIRKELADAGAIAGPTGVFGQGRYSAGNKARVYSELLARAKPLLDNGESVILDASWIDAVQRQRATALATDSAAELVEIRCCCPPQVAAHRIRGRGHSTSDATTNIATSMAASAEPWPQAYIANTDQPLTRTMSAARRAWQSAAAALTADGRTPAHLPG
ncbi:AAA family ATPase [Nocardia cyriacigeorgica]|uniref:bifunctional aminoglycoside phosphotransferase/ATP-binding protein n=1 Tax=Nocardia cyriacigeorgica TaxID=135487 RepID=UPI00189319AE|nr:bifunctional aminoglycoside phosphotransferase/ATP-binding protein [Nocardia cyriacigeorgica]MBF6399620.1 AAA family ATPase [Nocardia cyriacigeorgica]MBF6405250.1 AAA family ATPase [Nocardia cyriacigeorgica]